MEAEKQISSSITLRDLFPDVSDEQLAGLEEMLHGYLSVLWRIYERLKRERPDVFGTQKNGTS